MSYDPYLDKSLGEEQLAKLKTDEEANIIFARQDYWIKDGLSLGLESGKCYLIISAVDAFLQKAEPKLMKLVPGIKRSAPDLEVRIISEIEKERNQSESGLGMIFG